MATENDKDIESGIAAFEERRQHERQRFVIDLYFDGQDQTGVASLRDISLGGLYMNTSANFSEGDLLHLSIFFKEDEQFVTKAEVVYVNEGAGVGVKFVEVSDANCALLERKLSKH
jgi:hypothetical protein